jgi:Zn-dependent protease
VNEPAPDPAATETAEPAPRARAGRFVLMRLGSLEVEGHFALMPLLALIGFMLATSRLPAEGEAPFSVGEYWLIGGAGSILLLLSVFAHELAHALTARAHGLDVKKVSLFFHGDRFDERHEGNSPGAEFLIAGVGPATSIALGGLAWAGGQLLPESRLLTPLLQFTGVANLLLGLASLIPAFPLDGGRLVRAFFWAVTGTRLQGTRFACLAGRGLAAVFLAFAVVQGLRGSFGTGTFWLLALALLMHVQASATWRLARVREGLEGLLAGALARPLPPVIPRQVSVQDALFSPEYADLRESGRGYLVEFQGRLGGVVGLRDLRRVGENERLGTPVWEVTTRLRREHLLPASLPAGMALQRLIEAQLPLLPVFESGDLIGVLSRESLEAAIDERLAGDESRRNPQARQA